MKIFTLFIIATTLILSSTLIFSEPTIRNQAMQAQELIQLYYDSFNKGDMKTFVNLLDENVQHDLNQSERQIGKAKFTSFMERMNHSYKEQLRNIIIMTNPDGTHAAAEYIVDGTYVATDTGLPPANNQQYSLVGGAFFEIKNGKITRITNYYNLTDWLKQVTGK